MRYILLAMAVFMVLIDQTVGYSCKPCDSVVCKKPRGCRRRNYVKDICGCCNVCGRRFGQPCSEATPSCVRNLWCISIQGNSAFGRRSLTPGVPFNGLCGKIKVPRPDEDDVKVESMR